MISALKFDPWSVVSADATAEAAEARYLAQERAATIAESPAADALPLDPNRATPQWVLDILEAETLRPYFTPGQLLEPTPGARCGCCKSRSFWTDAAGPRGWRCSICHPALGMAADAVRITTT